ncbi:MAG: hypothetical protein HKO65_01330, partial [Gemmatimonadetes bacterium]|nr:hypothetical protein [Gemmatimonadota bacterium]NNM03715.1 hypothetical protein [Gemmatimonadota bacterium]
MRARLTVRLLAVWVLAGIPLNLTAQQVTYAPDAFLDPTAGELFRAAQGNWQAIDSSVVRYTSVIKQRIAAGIRTPLKDRTIYRNETAVRAFWDRDHAPIMQVMGNKAQYPGREAAQREDSWSWMNDLAMDEPFEPGGDRLLFGLTSDDTEEITDPDESDFWFAHPLAPGADSLYRFQSGDTLTLSLPDGRRLLTVQLDVLPREADVHRIAGTLWIEPESGALVRAVYQLSRELDVVRDIPDVRAEDEAGEFDMVPGILKPWIFTMDLVAIEYSLWDFHVWLPRSMRVEGEVKVGIMKMPIAFDLSYQLESVTMEDDLAEPPDPALVERHFDSRAEAMAFIASLLSDPAGVEYEHLDDVTRNTSGYDSRFIVPQDITLLEESPELPPPIWADAPGFSSEDELEDMVRTLADLPPIPTQGIPWDANWGWARHDLIRFNRVEGLAVGGRFEAELGSFMGPINFETTGFFGFGDLEPKGKVTFERRSVLRRVALSGYRELRPTNSRGRYLGLGNSIYSLFFGRDDGEYYMATGAELVWRPPETDRESFRLRFFAERQDSVDIDTNFSLIHAFDSDWDFRPNMMAQRLEEVGGELTLAPWWGSDPLATQVGLELYGQGGSWRHPDSTSIKGDYARASATVRVAIPLAGASWRIGLEAGGGTSWGETPLQRNWFLGGPLTLRGYEASVLSGPSFARGRLEVARTYS